MVIMGAGGHSKEVLEIVLEKSNVNDIAIYDNINLPKDIPRIFQSYQLLRTNSELQSWFQKRNSGFVIGVGGVQAKHKLWELATMQGGVPQSLLASNASIGKFDPQMGKGTTIMQFVFVSNSVRIGEAVLVNTRANIHHDVILEDFCEIGPGAIILGNCAIGSYSFIGSGAIVLPGIKIGNHCIIGAGAVVTKDVADNQVVKGNPAK